MQDIIDEGLKNRKEAASQAQEIILHQASHFMGWLRAQEYTHDIQLFRRSANAIRQQTLDHTLDMLHKGTATPEQALQHLAHSLTNKLIHMPTVQMKQAAQDGRTETLDVARELFNLRRTPDKS